MLGKVDRWVRFARRLQLLASVIVEQCSDGVNLDRLPGKDELQGSLNIAGVESEVAAAVVAAAIGQEADRDLAAIGPHQQPVDDLVDRAVAADRNKCVIGVDLEFLRFLPRILWSGCLVKFVLDMA